MKWQGVNKDLATVDLQPGESPDAVNCMFLNGIYSALGPRAGKSSVNTTAFSNNTNGIFGYNIAGIRRWIYSDDNGAITEYTPPYATWTQPSWGVDIAGTRYQAFNGALNGTVTLVNSPLTVTANLPDATVASWAGSTSFYFYAPTISGTLTGTGQSFNDAILHLYFGFENNVGAQTFNTEPDFTLRIKAGSPTNRTFSFAMPNEIEKHGWLAGGPDNAETTNSDKAVLKMQWDSVGIEVSAASATITGCYGVLSI